MNRPPPPIPVAIREAELIWGKTQQGGNSKRYPELTEILKGDVNTSTQMLYEVYAKVWGEETIPEDWKEGHLVKIPKMGDLTNCNNYRGITMLSVPGKILSRIILQRSIDVLHEILKDQ